MTEVIKATRAMRLVKQLLGQNKKLLAVQAIILAYDTNTVDANNFVSILETTNEE